MKLLIGLKSDTTGVGIDSLQNVTTKNFDILFNGTEEQCKNHLKLIRATHIKTKKFYDENLSESVLDRNYALTEKEYNKLYDKYIKMMIQKHDQYLLLDGEIL